MDIPRHSLASAQVGNRGSPKTEQGAGSREWRVGEEGCPWVRPRALELGGRAAIHHQHQPFPGTPVHRGRCQTASDGGTLVATELSEAALGTRRAFEVLAHVDKVPEVTGQDRARHDQHGARLTPVKASLLPHGAAGTTGHVHETRQRPKCAFEPRPSEHPKAVEPLTKYGGFALLFWTFPVGKGSPGWVSYESACWDRLTHSFEPQTK